MTAHRSTRSTFGTTSHLGRVTMGVSNMVGRFQNWNDQRSTAKVLSALTDRELADIGMIRGDIEGVTRAQHRTRR